MEKEINQTDANNRPHGYWEEQYPNGNTIYKGSYINGVKSGEWILYDSNGNPFLKCFYVNGQKHGKYEEYFDNGRLSAEGTFKNDCRTGYEKSYKRNGELYIITNLNMGLLHGHRIVLNDNQKIKSFEMFFENEKISDLIFN